MSFTLHCKGHIVCAGPERAGGRNSPKMFIQKEKSNTSKKLLFVLHIPTQRFTEYWPMGRRERLKFRTSLRPTGRDPVSQEPHEWSVYSTNAPLGAGSQNKRY